MVYLRREIFNGRTSVSAYKELDAVNRVHTWQWYDTFPKPTNKTCRIDTTPYKTTWLPTIYIEDERAKAA